MIAGHSPAAETHFCVVYPTEKATVNVIYGLYSEFKKGRPHYNINLCNKAALELWEDCSVLVNNGLAHWVNKAI
jgi:hypothetical protein